MTIRRLPLLSSALLAIAILQPADVALGQHHHGPRRGVMPKHVANAMHVAAGQTRIVVKLAEGRPELADGDQVVARDILELLGSRAIRPFFADHASQLASIRERQLARARPGSAPPVDLSLYFEAFAHNAEDVRQLVPQLNALASVELAYPRPQPTQPPGDIPPTTPDYTVQQMYRRPAPDGVDAHTMLSTSGASGAGVTVLDIEWGWLFGHEDISGLTAASLIGPSWFDPTYDDHGTAVCGVLAADADGAGATGLTPDVNLKVVTAYPASGYSVAAAIVLATPALQPHDVMLLEVQTSTFLNGLLPVEWHQAEFDSILVATSLGIHVVEAAGNGGNWLDDPILFDRFNLAVRDSGAIIVGASVMNAMVRASFSNFGSRVTANGWGTTVMTTGYGSLFSVPNTQTQDYTLQFSGTSSASPMVASAVAALVGAAKAQLDPAALAALDPVTVRTMIQNSGTAISHIGSRPDAKALLTAAGVLRGLTVHEEPLVGQLATIEFEPAFAGTNGDVYGLFGGTTQTNQPLPQPFVGDSRLLIDPTASMPIFTGAFGGQTATMQIQVPNQIALRGQSFYLQGITLDLNNNTMATTNNARIFLRK